MRIDHDAMAKSIELKKYVNAQTDSVIKKVFVKIALSIFFPLIDLLLVIATILLAYQIYWHLDIGRHVQYSLAEIIPISAVCAMITVMSMAVVGAYKNESSVLNVEEIRNSIKGISIGFFALMILIVFAQINISRIVIIISFLLVLIFIVLEKMILYNILAMIEPIKGVHKRVLIYGAGELGRALFRAIANSPKMRIIPAGFIDDDPNKQNLVCYQSGFNSHNCLKVLGKGDDVEKICQEYEIDEIYIAISSIKYRYLDGLLQYFKEIGVTAYFVPNLHEAFLHKVRIKKIGDIPTVRELDDNSSYSYLFLKRCLDILLSVALVIILLPILFLISIAIKIESSGSVLFKQKRVGKDGRIFTMYKFRSMFRHTEPYADNPTNSKDPRITRFGRIIRRVSLDELPQLFNVIKGEMSFVGPRPEMPFIVEQYNELHKERLKVLPGITGVWQLSGDRKKAMHENMDYDLYYIRNMSFFLDIAILFQTLIFAFKGI